MLFLPPWFQNHFIYMNLLFVSILRVWFGLDLVGGKIYVIVNIYTWADSIRSYGKGCVISGTCTERFANHNALGQLTSQRTFYVSEEGASSKQNRTAFKTVWEERFCNNANYMKNNGFLEQSSLVKTYSNTPQNLNQDFVNNFFPL